MTEEELHNFIEESGSSLCGNEDKVTIQVYLFNMDDFVKLIGTDCLSDGGMHVILYEDCISIDITDICNDNEVDVELAISRTL